MENKETNPEDLMSYSDEFIFITEFIKQLEKERQEEKNQKVKEDEPDTTFNTFLKICKKKNLQFINYNKFKGQDFNDIKVQKRMIKMNAIKCASQCINTIYAYYRTCIIDTVFCCRNPSIMTKIFEFKKKWNIPFIEGQVLKTEIDHDNIDDLYYDYEILKDSIEKTPGFMKIYNKYREFTL